MCIFEECPPGEEDTLGAAPIPEILSIKREKHYFGTPHLFHRHSFSREPHRGGYGLHCTPSHTRSDPRWCHLEVDDCPRPTQFIYISNIKDIYSNLEVERSRRSIPFPTALRHRHSPHPPAWNCMIHNCTISYMDHVQCTLYLYMYNCT